MSLVYGEVSIVNAGFIGSIGIGLVIGDYPSTSMPGWEDGGYGWHGDDGCIFGSTIQGQRYGSPFQTGDVIGVGYYPSSGHIFFTRNGNFMGLAFNDVPPLDYHLAVGCHAGDEGRPPVVRLNTGHEAFMYAHVGSKHLPRPDMHWTSNHPAIELREAREAAWKQQSCALIMTNASLIAHGRPAPMHSEEVSYWEVTFGINDNVDTQHSLNAAIGFATPPCQLDHFSVWSGCSFALCCMDGALVSSRDASPRPYCVSPDMFRAGATIGCGFDRVKGEMFFTCNGRNLGVAFIKLPIKRYHAVLALQQDGLKAEVNFGSSTFGYEPMERMRKLKEESMTSVTSSHADEAGLITSSPALPPPAVPASPASASSLSSATSPSTSSIASPSPPPTTSLLSPPNIDIEAPVPGLLSPLNNTLGHHSSLLHLESSVRVVHTGEQASSSDIDPNADRIIQPAAVISSLPLVPLPPEQQLDEADQRASIHSVPDSSLLPASFFVQTICPLFGVAEDEELAALLNRRAESGVGMPKPSQPQTGVDESRSALDIDAATLVLAEEEKLTYSKLNAALNRAIAMTNNTATNGLQPHRRPSDTSSAASVSASSSPSLSSSHYASSSILYSSLGAASILASNPAFFLQARVAFLQLLNELIINALPIVNLSKPAKRSVFSRHLRDPHIRSLFFFHLKRSLLRFTLLQTSVAPDTSRPVASQLFHLKLDVWLAQKLVQQGKMDRSGRKSLFGQMFQQLHLHRHDEENKYGDHDRDPARFHVRWRGKAWRTMLKGMYADDYGGVYRDILDRMCSELQSSILPLFIPCPNAREGIGENRNHFVPDPSATSPNQLAMFEFLGKLMGLAMRSGDTLSLDLPSIVWKPLVDDPVTEDDVMAIDRLSFKIVSEMRQLESSMRRSAAVSADGTVSNSVITQEEFKEYIDATFVVVGSDMKQHELIPGGENIPVTWNNRSEFISSLLLYRKHEFRVQCQAIRAGLSQVVPISLLSILTWQELRDCVCGQPTIDVGLLKSMSVYEGCSDRDPHIVYFWSVLNDWSKNAPHELNTFVQFVWGRSRLPSSAAEWERKFTLQLLHPRAGSDPDAYLPVAHTCFFSLELPAFSSAAVLKRRLLYAIHNCVAIDLDTHVQEARNEGRVESDDEEE